MMMLRELGVTLRPLQTWPSHVAKPTPADQRRGYVFRATLGNTCKLLATELRHLRAKSVVMEIALREQDIRLDGLPRANAVVSHPGIVLCFESKHGPLMLPCDSCTKWEHNLRAIAMHLEHLRLSALYGVGRGGEQYRGWKALPPPAAAPGDGMTLDQAAQWIAMVTGEHPPELVLWKIEHWRRLYLIAARRCHPDTGGSNEKFQQLQAVRKLLDKHHGL